MEERFVENGDVTIRVQVQGEGPTIVCVHGWPELSHSWRHQMRHFSERGWQVAAIDVRGYGGSSAPTEVERYTLRELATDVAAVAAELDDRPVVLFGHDWGAPIATHTAIRHPGRVRAVANLSVPHLPPGTDDLIHTFDRLWRDRFFYMLHFQDPGVVEAEFEADLRHALTRVYFAGSGAAPGGLLPEARRGAPFLPLLPDPPPEGLAFMSADDLDMYVSSFRRAGTIGAFNRYRAMRLDGAANVDIVGARLDQPSCFIGGEHDLVRYLVPGVDSYRSPGAWCSDFRGSTIMPGIGHWVQQEAPERVNEALDAFVGGL